MDSCCRACTSSSTEKVKIISTRSFLARRHDLSRKLVSDQHLELQRPYVVTYRADRGHATDSSAQAACKDIVVCPMLASTSSSFIVQSIAYCEYFRTRLTRWRQDDISDKIDKRQPSRLVGNLTTSHSTIDPDSQKWTISECIGRAHFLIRKSKRNFSDR